MVKKVEVLANVAVIVTSVVLCSVLAKKYFFTAKPAVAAAPSAPSLPVNARNSALQPGTKISLPGIDWSQSNQTLVLALSTTCHFCTESAPLYQVLEKEKLHNVRLLAILPQPANESRKYLTKLGLQLPDLVQTPLASIGISGTPTLVLVDNNGLVKRSWIGKLGEADSRKLIAELKNGT